MAESVGDGFVVHSDVLNCTCDESLDHFLVTWFEAMTDIYIGYPVLVLSGGHAAT